MPNKYQNMKMNFNTKVFIGKLCQKNEKNK